MYWAVIAVIAAYEYSVEFLISWYVRRHCELGFVDDDHAPFGRFPFYYELKTLFLIFLVLPQTQVRLHNVPLCHLSLTRASVALRGLL